MKALSLIDYYILELYLIKCHLTSFSCFTIDDSAVAPSVGGETNCTEAQLVSDPFSFDLKLMDNKLYPIQEQLQFLLREADELQNLIVYRCSQRKRSSQGTTHIYSHTLIHT